MQLRVCVICVRVSPIAGELFYLRHLLLNCRGPCRFEDLRTIDGDFYDTFRETCQALGLLVSVNTWKQMLSESF